MTRQEVNSEQISTASNSLRTTIINIDNDFDKLRGRMRQLESWRGAAGTAAQTTMHQIFNFNDARSKVLQNYLNMLEQQVNPGYQSAETTNRSLADKFK